MSSLQVIYYGAPGTGKSYAVDNLEEIKKANNSQIFRTTFHPEYAYSDFTGQLLPIVKEEEITYDYQPGVFTSALKQAFKDTSKPVYLIIEEMSRGNVAAIFGDVFQLLDRDDKDKSRYPVRNSVIANQITQINSDDDIIYLPANFNILGTVNTSDQNVFVMDTAFKRRFDWQYISTFPVKNEDGTINNDFNINISLVTSSGVKKISWYNFYLKLNMFITDKNNGLGLSEDKQIGQFFLNFNKQTPEHKIKDTIQNKLLQYLWEDVQSASYTSSLSLFDLEISSFSNLYYEFSNDRPVFSNLFLEYIDSVSLPKDIL